jgi:thiol-disulfide isomerase/thioredoxin
LAPVNQFKKWLTIKNLLNGLFFIAVAVIAINPAAKAFTLQALMKVGLFQPSVTKTQVIVVPEISFTDEQGKTLLLSSLKGKVVFINFWATWCPPCLAELPAINGLYHKQSKNSNLVFLMVDVDNNVNYSAAFMAKHGYALPVYAASALPNGLVGDAIPTTIIIDKKGKMVFKHEGVANYAADDFAAYLSGLVNEK